MKTSNSTPKTNKIIMLVCVILLAVHSPAFSQNKLVSIIASVNPSFAIPVVCLLGLAVFLFSAFLKQKNH